MNYEIVVKKKYISGEYCYEITYWLNDKMVDWDKIMKCGKSDLKERKKEFIKSVKHIIKYGKGDGIFETQRDIEVKKVLNV